MIHMFFCRKCYYIIYTYYVHTSKTFLIYKLPIITESCSHAITFYAIQKTKDFPLKTPCSPVRPCHCARPTPFRHLHSPVPTEPSPQVLQLPPSTDARHAVRIASEKIESVLFFGCSTSIGSKNFGKTTGVGKRFFMPLTRTIDFAKFHLGIHLRIPVSPVAGDAKIFLQ